VKIIFRDLKVIFDPRGFYPEEGVVKHRWKESSLTFRIWKRVENYLLRRSDKVIALSQTFLERVAEVTEKTKCTVIYASADLDRFRHAGELRQLRTQEPEENGKMTIVYVGGLGAWHDPGLLAKVFKVISQAFANARLLVITPYSREKLERVFQSVGLARGQYAIVSAEQDEVPGQLVAADFGIVPLREAGDHGAIGVVADTMIGTKVAEYLASGLPIIVNKNVSGIRPLMERFKLGMFFDPDNLGAIIPGIRHISERYQDYQADCRLAASRYLSLDQTVRSYFDVYQELADGPSSEEDEIKLARAGQ
jgi:glycosyltransferase involved in cell wall biosynthesis